jgi:hypothetical protein
MPRPPVLLLSPDHWRRVLVAAELLERGYDVAVRPGLAAAFLDPPAEPGRDPLALVVLDQGAMAEQDRWLVDLLLARHGRPPVLLLARGPGEPPPGPWARVLRRPVSVREVVSAAEALAAGGPRDEGTG